MERTMVWTKGDRMGEQADDERLAIPEGMDNEERPDRIEHRVLPIYSASSTTAAIVNTMPEMTK